MTAPKTDHVEMTVQRMAEMQADHLELGVERLWAEEVFDNEPTKALANAILRAWDDRGVEDGQAERPPE